MNPRSGREEAVPYSLSRWTDIAGGTKWDWFLANMTAGRMHAFDPRTGTPDWWSLRPEDTHSLVFWTKTPKNIVRDFDRLEPYRIKAHVTITGWSEVEHAAPSIEEATKWACELSDRIGKENLTWRFSPVPLLDDDAKPSLFSRFESIASKIHRHTNTVFLSFLQPNDLVPETRDDGNRSLVMSELGHIAEQFGLQVRLCNADSSDYPWAAGPPNLSKGVCVPCESVGGGPVPVSEKCGCAIMVDPFTINETCTMGCEYCLDPSTPVLYSDMVWRPIGEARVGDSLVGFDEFPTLGGGSRMARRMRETIIEAVSVSKQLTTRMITNQSDVVTTANHGWINDRGRWLSTRTIWGQGPMRTKLRQIGQVKDLPFTEEYKLGYLASMTLGDGTMRYQSGQRSDKLGFPQAYWRVALKDEAPLGRLVAYLASFGVETNIRPFDSGSSTAMSKVEVRALGRLQRIQDLLLMQSDSMEYRRGYLAGFYDAEGNTGWGNLRVSQKDRSVLHRVGDYARNFGFNLDVEPCTEDYLVGTSRLKGSLRERMRFISTIRPALARRSPEWLGWAFEADDDPVMCKESAGLREVVDIQTSTHTFFAAGLATHNCYAADKTLSMKKRNTTRGLPVLK